MGMRSYENIKQEIEKNLTESRFKHCLNVQNEAVKLGKIYGANIEKCMIAGIAHDCVKCFSDDELLKMAIKYGINIDNIQYYAPQLLHGPVGAKFCRENFEVSDEDILNAISYHTTGRASMSLLEKIIYISDLIEESRNFDGIEIIRKEVNTNLDKAILMACNSTIEFILNKNILIHPLTIELRNDIVIKNNNK